MEIRLSVAKSFLQNGGSTPTANPSPNNPQRLTTRCFPELIPKRVSMGDSISVLYAVPKGKEARPDTGVKPV